MKSKSVSVAWIRTNLSTIAIILFVFIVSFQPSRDLDLGWHLRYGEYFFQTGQLLKQNILSFVWPDYQWVQASWLYDLLVYQLFRTTGFFGLSLVGAIVSTAIFTLCLQISIKKNLLTGVLLAALYLSQSFGVYNGALRTQSVSALLFTLVLVLIGHELHKHYGTKRIFLLPIVFFLWANLHGGFALGLFLATFVWMISGVIHTLPYSSWRRLGTSLACSFAATFVNPYGWRVYEETFKHMTSVNATLIKEWYPLAHYPVDAAVTTVLVALAAVIILWRKRVADYPIMVAYIIVAILALNAIRFTIVLSVMATYIYASLFPRVRVPLVVSLLTTFTVATLILYDSMNTNRYILKMNTKPFTFSWNDYCTNYREIVDCSEQISEIMRRDPPVGNGYNWYNNGGYLSWRAGGVKTFIDGRMTAWSQDGKIPPVTENLAVIDEEVPLAWWKLNNEYNFRWAIVPTNAYIREYLDTLVVLRVWRVKYQDTHWSYYVKN